MKTYILPLDRVEDFRKAILSSDIPEYRQRIMIDMSFGLEELELEDAKKMLKLGDTILVKYTDKFVPWQCIHKFDDGTVALQSYYLLERREFDKKTNVWKDSSIREYLNGEFMKKLDPEFVAACKPTEVHTDNYTTIDKFFLLSHEEIGYEDKNNMFKKNIGAITYDYYK